MPRAKAKDLVIVESPAKARTLERLLGNRYQVKASKGHIRDLPEKELGIDVANDFRPRYAIVKDKLGVVAELKRAASEAEMVYLATDPDREGEAISWHVAQAAQLDPREVRRVVFHEFTDDAIRRAFRHPREIDMELVNAQQARRLLDRLVGYKISPVLWRKVRGGLSAGRVQSVTLRLVAEREREIEAFVSREYWTIGADLASAEGGAAARALTARLEGIVGRRKELEVPDQETADGLVAELQPATYSVAQVKKRQTRRRPAPPFITSTLQQEAWRKLRFSARKTMSVAQQLYEGLPIGQEGPVGLITYMRTDSTNLASQAQQEMRRLVAERYGAEYVPKTPRTYRGKVKGAQEAHEAIRPTSIDREPASLRDHLTQDQLRLYELVWRRALASQIADALLDSTTIDIHAAETPSRQNYLFRATGSVLRFPGFLAVYQEGRDDGSDEEEMRLPDLVEGQLLRLLELHPQQHFTQPPPRYNDATLVKALEERGIGRPSTYAPILSTILDRGYVEKQEGRFHPLKLGLVVNDLLVEHFPDIVDPDFTAQMEEELDEIARGEREWVPVLRQFYGPFERTVERAMQEMPRVKGSQMDEPTEEACEKCGRPMVIKTGRYGRFMACTGFPQCRNTRDMAPRLEGACPLDGGDLVERRARKTGRPFYGCANYPTCTFIINDRPLTHPCPECGGLVVARGRDAAKCTKCAWQGPLEELEEKETVGV